MNYIFNIFLFIIITTIIMYFGLYYNNADNNTLNCNILDLDIDNLVIIKRSDEYKKLINNLIDNKKFIFNDNDISILKNTNQIYQINNNFENDQTANNITNITNKIINCSNVNNNDEITENFNSNNIYQPENNEYIRIVNKLSDDNNNLLINCSNIPNYPNSNYMDNYYWDVFGNKIQSKLSDYYADYYTNINKNPKECVNVKTLQGKSNFIIPSQYSTEKYLTNAYNVDWNRIINPLSYH